VALATFIIFRLSPWTRVAVGKPDNLEPKADKAQLYKVAAFRVVAAQFLTAVSIAAAVWIFAEPRAAYSALIGGMAGALPSLYLAARMFRRNAGVSAPRILKAIYLGEAIKFTLTVALFVIAMRLLDVNVLIMFGAYLATVLVNWFALLAPDPVFKLGSIDG